jgi:hypothetical protein
LVASFKGQDGVLGVAQGVSQGGGGGVAQDVGVDLEDEGALEREHWKERVKQAESDLLREQETSARFPFSLEGGSIHRSTTIYIYLYYNSK